MKPTNSRSRAAGHTPQFKPLKAGFENSGIEFPLIPGAIIATNSYRMFLGKPGYRVIVVKHNHESDCRSRLGPKGGNRAVLPIHDIASSSTMVPLVNHDSTETTAGNSVKRCETPLAEFKIQLMNHSGNAS